jgi:exodeoxyribonuclease V gamma subunit
MRGLPFAVVCLLGLNDGAYPRPVREPSFDRIGQFPRPGDRIRRDDDRYLFLEALLSARRCLYLSYCGQHIRDNSELPPSVLVSELLDYIERAFRAPAGGPVLPLVLTRHPLQPFNRRYFQGDPRLFSYSGRLCAASRALCAGQRPTPGPWLREKLPPADAQWRALSLDELLQFYRNPARYLLRRRLGVYLAEDEGLLEPDEPFAPDYRSMQSIRQELLALQRQGTAQAEALVRLRAASLLPHGEVGACWLAIEQQRVRGFTERLAELDAGVSTLDLELDFECSGLRLSGRLGGVGPQGLVLYRPDVVRPRDRICLWIQHLVLNLLAPSGQVRRSVWVGEDRSLRLRPVQDPKVWLAGLLENYWAGLHRPLPFFPNTSFAYAEARRNAKEDPLKPARSAWLGSEYQRGDWQEPYLTLAFRDSDPLDDAFCDLAVGVFHPLFEHLEPMP